MSRPGKPDFAPHYKMHRKILEKNGLDAEEMIAMRKNLHRNPEGGFKEFDT
jgi:metal-dependent amidase/aminoacylase/carboxypeptidase family protein